MMRSRVHILRGLLFALGLVGVLATEAIALQRTILDQNIEAAMHYYRATVFLFAILHTLAYGNALNITDTTPTGPTMGAAILLDSLLMTLIYANVMLGLAHAPTFEVEMYLLGFSGSFVLLGWRTTGWWTIRGLFVGATTEDSTPPSIEN